MAKLSARGRKEIYRLSKLIVGDDLISGGKNIIAIMDDGIVLKKRIVTFSSDNRRRDYGWKKLVKLACTADAYKEFLQSKDYCLE